VTPTEAEDEHLEDREPWEIDKDNWVRWLREGVGCAKWPSEAPAGLWAVLVTLCERDDYLLDRHEPTAKDEAKAWVDHKRRRIWVPPGISERDAMARLLHEYAHIRLRHFPRKLPRWQEEAEADSVAFLVGEMHWVNLRDLLFEFMPVWRLADDWDESMELAARHMFRTACLIAAEVRNELGRRSGGGYVIIEYSEG
jgi:hypothetical protein